MKRRKRKARKHPRRAGSKSIHVIVINSNSSWTSSLALLALSLATLVLAQPTVQPADQLAAKFNDFDREDLARNVSLADQQINVGFASNWPTTQLVAVKPDGPENLANSSLQAAVGGVNRTLVISRSADAVGAAEEANGEPNDRHTNALDDLLAVETSRVLVIGKQPDQQQPLQFSEEQAKLLQPQLANQPQPPYSSNLTATQTTNLTIDHIRPISTSQLAKLYRAPAATAKPPFRFPLSTYLSAGQQVPISASLAWPNVYLVPVTSSTQPPSAPERPSLVQPEIGASSASNWSQALRQQLNTTLEPIEWRSNRSSIEYEVEQKEPKGLTDKTDSFPSLLNSSHSEEEHQEAQRQRQNASATIESTLSAGHYQRTNTSSMSWSQLLRQATESNVMESLMVTNKSMVSLLCDTNDMLVRFRFEKPFRGTISTNLDPRRSCRLVGNGGQHYKMRVSLHDCGTRQEMPRLFVNNILIHFHQGLDMVDDELKTIICSYPIRPRAPPPPANPPASRSERIVKAPSEPARLVYYEPLVLISSLLLFSIALLGLTTGAYVFSRRSGRSASLAGAPRSRAASFSSSRIYRTAPSRAANLWAVPPLIGGVKSGQGSSPSMGASSPIARARKYPNAQTEVKGKLESNSVSMEDSLGEQRADESSVTTIEIPLSTKTKPNLDQSVMVTMPTQTLARPSQQQPIEQPASSPVYSTAVKRSTERASARLTRLKRIRSSTKTTRSVGVSATPTGTNAPPVPKFGSLRKQLTSPAEYRRLQAIARLFREVLVETRQVDSATGEQKTFPERRLVPSKYRAKIVNQLSEDDRRVVGEMLSKDEVFRSHVIESTDIQTFRRKLRYSPVYAGKFKPQTWELLEEIILDSELSSANDTSDEPTESSSDHRKQERYIAVVEECTTDTSRLVGPGRVALIATDRSPTVPVESPIRQSEVSTKPPDQPVNVEQVQQSLSKKPTTTTIGASCRVPKPIEIKFDRATGGTSSRNKRVDGSSRLESRVSEGNVRDSLGSDSGGPSEPEVGKSREQLAGGRHAQQSREPMKQSDSVNHGRAGRRDINANTSSMSPMKVRELDKSPRKSMVRVSQFNSTKTSRQVGGLAGTLINIDSVTNFTDSKDFSTYTRSSIEHTRYEQHQSGTDSSTLSDETWATLSSPPTSLAYVDEDGDEKVASYEYARETFKLAPGSGCANVDKHPPSGKMRPTAQQMHDRMIATRTTLGGTNTTTTIPTQQR